MFYNKYDMELYGKTKKRKVAFWLLTFLLMNLLDIYLTNYFLTNTAIAEANPIGHYLYEHWGLLGLFFIKFASILVVWIICRKIYTLKPDTAHRLAQLATFLLALVVIYSGFCILISENISNNIEAQRDLEQTGQKINVIEN